jgi:FKBP-type peptidyl-prolyl cis-trans isomerase
MHPRLFAFALLSLFAFVVPGCRSVTSDSDPPRIEDTQFASALGVDLSLSTKTASGLYWRDLAVGTGATVGSGQQVRVHYTGWLANGAKFDENLPPQTPFTFTVGATPGAIAGFDEGVRGMKVGGTRQLIIPPHLAYGPNGSGPIPGNAILVFRVEVVGVQ